MKIFIIFILIFVLGLTTIMKGQNKIAAGVFGNGASAMAGTNNLIAGTIGQGLIGVNTGVSNKIFSGFWYMIAINPTGIEEEQDMNTSSLYLGENYPNPFSSKTLINYQILNDSHVRLEIYNLLGEHIKTLVNERKQPGKYVSEWYSENYENGTYYCVLKTGNNSVTRIMELLK